MRILRFPRQRAERPLSLSRGISLAADRFLALETDDELRLYDLDSPDTPDLSVPGAAGHALAPGCLIVQDVAGGLRRFERRDSRWQFVSRLPTPEVPEATSREWLSLILSPSGRYLLVESAPISREPYWAVSRAFLLDALTGETMRAFNLGKTVVRAGFATLPSGPEVLFISADSYMSVQMVDCASGRLLHEYVTRSGDDFCHTNYWLSADGTILFVYGCHWASPWEMRIYDATPWTFDAAPAEDGFPLPIVYLKREQLWIEFVQPARPLATADGAITCCSLVEMPDFPEPGTAKDADERQGITGVELSIYERLLDLPRTGSALVIRRVDPVRGDVLGWTVTPVGNTDERHLRLLANHRVLVLTDRVLLVDGLTGQVSDNGPFDRSVPMSAILVTSDGETLILVQQADSGSC